MLHLAPRLPKTSKSFGNYLEKKKVTYVNPIDDVIDDID